MQTDERRGKSFPTIYKTWLHCNNEKLGHLLKHFEIVGRDRAVIDSSDKLSDVLSKIAQSTRSVLESEVGESKSQIQIISHEY